ncbi:unnamed protein product [marine sediment metagenome]|uniref:YgjP-like metallopeptidase domain-containing protein n=1 Tax=marine sediment metagenome TaxID=412755 RepID=X0RQN7_9ZZZZ
MITKPKRVQICNLEIQTVRKDIKNIHLGVYPPSGRIRVAAPLKTSDETIRLFVISKMPWIKKQRLKFIRQERQSRREFVSGESHYFLGNRYRLNVITTNHIPKAEIRRKRFIDLYVKPDTNRQRREKILENFYRYELKKNIPPLIIKWQKKTKINVKEFRIRKMKTKWGTSNPSQGRIWLNLELTKKPIHCLEYVLVHEMVHLIEKKHTDRFVKLMKRFLPQWESYKCELNKSVLGYFSWDN